MKINLPVLQIILPLPSTVPAADIWKKKKKKKKKKRSKVKMN